MAVPTDYAGLQGWWDASQESFANNDPVGTFTDRSGNSRNLTSTLTARPTFKTSMFPLGGSGIDFDGTDDKLASAADFTVFTSTTAYTAFVVVTPNTIGTAAAAYYDNDAVWTEQNGNAALAFHSTTPTVLAGNWDGSADSVSKTVAAGTSYVVMVRHESSNLYISIDGGAESSVASGTTASGANFKLQLGANYANAAFADITIGELFIYNVALTTSEISALNDYLRNKWIAAAATNASAGVATSAGAATQASISKTTNVALTLNAQTGVLAYATDETPAAGELAFDFVDGSISLVISGAAAAAATNVDAAAATGAGAANTTQSTVQPVVGVATSAGAGNTAQSSLKPSAGEPAAAGAANAATVTVGTVATAGEAAGAGTSHASTTTVTTASGSAASTGTANNATGAAVRPTATGAGTANNSTALVSTPTTTGTGAGAANDATVTVTATAAAGLAAGAGTADPATVDGAVVSAGFGVGPDSVITYAVDPTPAEHAMVFDFVTGQVVLLLAYDPASSTSVNAGAAEATGTTTAPSVDVAVPAATAAGVGVAETATTGHEPATATSAAVAHDASVTATTTLDTAISAGLADNATVTLAVTPAAALSVGVANPATAITVIPDLNDRAIKITIRDHGHTVTMKRRA